MCNSIDIQHIPNIFHSKCSSLTEITIPSSVIKIGNDAFLGCSPLVQITIPSSVTSIGNNDFKGCSSLTEIAIPSSVTSIGWNAFDLNLKDEINKIQKLMHVKLVLDQKQILYIRHKSEYMK